ncbi:MAG: protein kinase [Planctomycetota bacterium]
MAQPPPQPPQPPRHGPGSTQRGRPGESGSGWPQQDSGQGRTPQSDSAWPQQPRTGPGSTLRARQDETLANRPQAWPQQGQPGTSNSGLGPVSPTSPSDTGSAWPRTISNTGSAWPRTTSNTGSAHPGQGHPGQGPSGTVRQSSQTGSYGPSGTLRDSRGSSPGQHPGSHHGQGSSWSGAGSQSSWPGGGGSGRRLPRVGQTLGPYTIDEVLGQGSMGRVYRAHDPLGRPVALKAILMDMADQEGLDRFVREGQAMAAIPPHPGVMRVHAAGEAQGIPYLVFELIEGESLEQRLVREGKLPLGEALELARLLAEALDHIHRQGVVHRDLKPANVLLRREGGPCLADFGLARLTGAESLTATGDLLGTPLYMPPEQVTGRRNEVDARSDLWSLGVILYRMCSGEVPFRGASFNETAEQILEAEPRALHSLVERAGPLLTSVVERALAKDKEERYASAREFADALAELCDGRVTRASITGMLSRGRRRTLARVGAAATLGGLLLAVLTGVIVSRVLQAREQALAGDLQALQDDAEQATGDLLSAKGEALDALAARLEALRARDRRDRFAARLDAVAASLGRGRFAAALGRGDLEAAARAAEAETTPEEHALRGALLAQARGQAPALEPLTPLLERSDAVGEAAKVLFARALRERDPAQALLHLRGAAGPAAERERRWARLFAAIDDRDPQLAQELTKKAPDPALSRAARARAAAACLALLPRRPLAPVTELLARIRVVNAITAPERDEPQERALLQGALAHAGLLINSGEPGPDGEPRPGDLIPTLDQLVELFHEMSRLRIQLRLEPPRNLGHVLLKDPRKQITYEDVLKVALALVHLDVPIPTTLVGTAPYGPEEQRRLASLTDPAARHVALSIRAAQPGRLGEEGRRELLDYLEHDAWAKNELGPRNRAAALSWGACALELPVSRRRALVDEALRLDPTSFYVRSAHALALAFERKGDEAARLGEQLLVDFDKEQLEKEGRRAETVPPYILRRVILIHALRGDRDRINVHLERLRNYPVVGQATLEDAKALLPR